MYNELLTTILLEYEQKKQKAEIDLDNRKQELYKKVPRLQEIEQELNSFAINTAKNILNGTCSSLQELNKKVADLKKEKSLIFKKYNITEAFLKPNYECKLCNDTGYIQGNNSASSMCSCLKQRLLDISYNKSNISNLEKENFNTFNINVLKFSFSRLEILDLL